MRYNNFAIWDVVPCFDTFLTDIERAMRKAKEIADHTCWIRFVCRPKLEPNPLKILARALNGLWLKHRSIRQPCWSARRWKSLT